MKKSVFLVLIISSAVFNLYAQQDPLYNQYLFSKLMINPAYAGIYDRFSATLISRAQWAGLEGAPKTQTLAAHSALMRGKVGAGLLVIYDELGVNATTEVQTSYSYNIIFPNGKLAMGVQGGLISYSYNYSDLRLDFTDDPLLSTQNEKFTEPNFGFGVMYMTDLFFAGVSVPRILDVEVGDGILSSTRYKNHYYFATGGVLSASEFVKIKLSSLVRYTIDAPLSVDVSGSLLIGEFLWAGLMVRNLNALGVITSLEVSDQFRFGYAFEFPTNDLNFSNFGTHEISLAIDLDLFAGHQLVRKYF